MRMNLLSGFYRPEVHRIRQWHTFTNFLFVNCVPLMKFRFYEWPWLALKRAWKWYTARYPPLSFGCKLPLIDCLTKMHTINILNKLNYSLFFNTHIFLFLRRKQHRCYSHGQISLKHPLLQRSWVAGGVPEKISLKLSFFCLFFQLGWKMFKFQWIGCVWRRYIGLTLERFCGVWVCNKKNTQHSIIWRWR